ncbi:MAG: hypothetical protein J6P64_05340 [Bacteroidales bacterium]|nr:hypothetical protein [Bacteroidales bacterium]
MKNVELPELSKEAKKRIDDFWIKYIHRPIGYTYFRSVVFFLGKEPQDLYLYIPRYIWYPFMYNILNPPTVTKAFSDKILFPLLFPSVKHPRIIIGYYNGSYITDKFSPITEEQAIARVLDYGKPIIIKQSVDTKGGKGIEFLDQYDSEILRKTFDSRKKNFLVQEIIEQSDDIAFFNPSSLNTIRLETLYFKGKSTVVFRMLRHGVKGMRLDNLSSGGIGVGIREDGTLSLACFDDINGIIDTHYSGKKYSECKIPNFSTLCDTACRLHYYVSQVGFIGWDFALDKNNEPVLIEANFYHPGMNDQFLNEKPLFGNRTQEVIDYCFNRK